MYHVLLKVFSLLWQKIMNKWRFNATIHCFTQNSSSNTRIITEESQPSTSWAAIIHFWRTEISFWGSPKHLCGFYNPYLHCPQWKAIKSPSPETRKTSLSSAQQELFFVSLSDQDLLPHTHLFRAEFCVALPQFAWSAFNDCIAEHCDHHHKEEVTGVHEVQVY